MASSTIREINVDNMKTVISVVIDQTDDKTTRMSSWSGNGRFTEGDLNEFRKSVLENGIVNSDMGLMRVTLTGNASNPTFEFVGIGKPLF